MIDWFRLFFPILHIILSRASWDPLEDIKENNQKLAQELKNGK